MENLLQDLKVVATEQQKDISEIKARLQEQLVGVKASESFDPENENAGLAEKTSLRELLEKTSFQMDSVISALETIDNKISSGASSTGLELTSSSSNFNQRKTLATGDAIRAKTDADEQEILLEKFEGREKEDATDPNVYKIKKDRKMFVFIAELKGIKKYMTVEMENHLDLNLDALSYSFTDPCVLDLKPVVNAGTCSLLTISDPYNYDEARGINGYLSYRLTGEGVRLVIQIVQSRDIDYLAAAFVPEWLPISRSTFSFDPKNKRVWRRMANKRWLKIDCDDDGNVIGSFVLRHHQILAKIEQTNSNIRVIIMKTASTNDHLDSPERTEMKEVALLHCEKSIRGDMSSTIQKLLGNYGYVLEISNFRSVWLNDPKLYSQISPSNLILPQLVVSLGIEVLVIKTAFSGQHHGGIFTFRIGTTDLRLAIAFQLFHRGNKFALAFVPAYIPTDAQLMQFLTDENGWNTCMDHSYAQAKDGEQVIETRNIQASASMTNNMMAQTQVSIRTY